jgi:DNA-binding MarR family transcriptional regulator
MESQDAERLRRAVVKLGRRLNEASTAVGLTPTQSSVLSVIAHRGSVSSAEIVKAEGINPSMLSRLLAQLEERGLVRRESDPDDQRQRWVVATARGRALARRIRAARTSAVAALADRLDGSGQERLLDALDVLDRLVELADDGARPIVRSRRAP